MPDYAAHEAVYFSQAITADDFAMKKNPKYVNKVVAPTLEPISSIGGFRTLPDYSFDTMPDDYVALVLIGGFGWNTPVAEKVMPIIKSAIEQEKVIGAICNAASFMAKCGIDRETTSKTLQKSSVIQKISVTLSSVIIAIIVCKLLIFNTLRLQQLFANHHFQALIFRRTHVKLFNIHTILDTCLDLIALQYTCMIVMAMLAFFVFVSRYYVTCRNRQFEQSRWMIVVALLLFVVHYMCQMRLGWRQQGNDVGVLFNLLFYSPSAILLSWSQLNILRAGHRRWSFMRYGVVGYALMVLCIVAGVISMAVCILVLCYMLLMLFISLLYCIIHGHR